MGYFKMGYVHAYVGENWKSLKTSHGMALRACGAGFNVAFYSFGEEVADAIELESRLPSFKVLDKPDCDISPFDVVIFHDCDLAGVNLQKFIESRPPNTEIVLCGTSLPGDILAMADLVSDIKTI